MRRENEDLLVSIKSSYNDMYVSVEGELDILKAEEDEIEESERFIMIKVSNNKIILQSNSGFYVRLNKENELSADSTNINDALVLAIVPINNQELALKGDNGKYVKVRTNDNTLELSGDDISKFTTFKIREITEIKYDDVGLESASKETLTSVNEDGILEINPFADEDTYEFTMIEFKGDKIALKSYEDKYVRIREDMVLIADEDNKENATKFLVIQTNENGEVMLKADNGYLVRVRSGDNYLVADAIEENEDSKFMIFI